MDTRIAVSAGSRPWDPVRTFYGVVFGDGLAALLSIWWVRFFTTRWLPAPADAEPHASGPD